jgi:hypothetical protein
MTKKVRCFDCGYLCLEETKTKFLGDRTLAEAGYGRPAWKHPEYDIEKQYLEITPQNRKDPTGLKESAQNIFCYRHAFLLSQEMKTTPKRNLSKNFEVVVEKPCECKYHVQYIPGYDPAQHLTRWESLERERVNRRWSLFYIALGSGITIAGMLAIRYFWG